MPHSASRFRYYENLSITVYSLYTLYPVCRFKRAAPQELTVAHPSIGHLSQAVNGS